MRRPLLALGLVLVAPLVGAQPRFEEAGEAWGARFRHHHGGTGDFFMIETMGAGVVIFDYDGDGDPDLLFLDSGPLPIEPGAAPSHRLLRNDGAAGFVDVTAAAGLVAPGYVMGGTAGDATGDGNPDLYLTAFGPNLLFRNRGDGTFERLTRAGAHDPSWGASAAFADLDGDGYLDLYVTNYLDFSFDDNPVCGRRELGIRSYCHPDVYDGVADRYFRNRGDGTFEDATAAAGLAGADGKGLGVVIADLTGDGLPDVYVANDMTPNFLFANRGDGTFEETALLAGVALSDLGKEEAGMGIALGDLDGDGLPDLFVTHLDLQTNAFYRNRGDGLFADARFTARLAEPSLYFVGFGAAAADFDNDGDLDLAVANGHILHNAELFGTGTSFRQRNQLFENLGGGVFREAQGSGLDAVRASRGLAVADLDGDGRVDLVTTSSDDFAEVYRNVSSPAGSWLRVDLAGSGPNRAGVGALVALSGPRGRQVREVVTASSYLSQNELTLHFGLGEATEARDLSVRWPSGKRQRFARLPARRSVRLHEGEPPAAAPATAAPRPQPPPAVNRRP
jgi:enediyne biosynthesis protein E4